MQRRTFAPNQTERISHRGWLGSRDNWQLAKMEDVVVDVVIVGAGFSGLFMLHRVRQLGLTARVFEAGDDVGGTWYWNRYPGARCDIESVEYSYSFDADLQQHWVWSERFAGQPEILSYLQHVAERFELRQDIQFSTRVTGAQFDDASGRWTVVTSDGNQLSCRFLIAAVGCLSSANMPNLPGRDTFMGATYHTGQWPHEGVDFTGLRVGVVGTGSSAVQSIPLIAEQARHLTVFQRTPTYAAPARNEMLPLDELNEVKANYAELREGNQHMSGAYGSRTTRGDRSAFAVSDDERQRDYQDRWERAGSFCCTASMTC
jgi:cation diffusion facilitator CzcD-associated flavoprotein CzcO